jgi:hypothetical protein
MKKALVAGFGFLVLVSSMAGCMQGGSTAPVASLQQECERSGGLWRGGICQRESGGGGY